jgi:ABC-2 type transport system ATP-binding protein
MTAFELEGLVKRFPDFQLGPMSLAPEPGTVLACIGPNGAGKSTMMHCMMGLLRPDKGSVTFFGQPNDLNKPAWKHDVGYVGDQPPFYDHWSCEKNLKFLASFYPTWSQELVDQLIGRFDLPPRTRFQELSTGNKVKLSLIAALAYQPRLLLLDEPTSGLDPVVRTELLDVLFDVVGNEERAIFYSTHVLSDIERLADELVFIVDGKLRLRTDVEILRQNWRRMAFSGPSELGVVKAAVSLESENSHHQLITADFEKTSKHLSEMGISSVETNAMSVNEIAVEILKSERNKSKSYLGHPSQPEV